MTRSRSRLVLALPVLLGLLAPASARAAETGFIVSGTVTISGIESRDELQVRVEGDRTGTTRPELIVTPATTVTATTGTCPKRFDPVTNRPVDNRCNIGSSTDVVVNLGGGDDDLRVSDDGAVRSFVVSGGAGNDVIDVSGAGRTLRGGDGDDVLRAPSGSLGVNWDGGAGRDLVDFADTRGSATSSTASTPVGVTASLATGRASAVFASNLPGEPPVTRNDTLTGVERLSGTELGDIFDGGTGADELLGQGGEDILKGGDGNDSINGGLGSDELSGGKGANTIDGGPGRDDFPTGTGSDTFLTRDGLAESVTCVTKDVVVNDLADKVGAPANCLSVSTAARVHRFDTRLSGRALRVGADGALRVLASCPARKTERCSGTLRARLGGPSGPALGRALYRLRPGRRATLRLPLSAAEVARVHGRAVTLDATEVDNRQRPRRILSRTRVR